MPLVRFPVRNEFKLGQPELYTEVNREDPKAILDGVAVAGLVGILRQLGDLAEFSAEVFHGLQEQVMIIASRSHKLLVRVQHIEATLPPLEKAVLSQTSHIHFAYTAGHDWHPHLRNEQNHFVYNDLPRFIMDSYEECRDPPRLHLLDKFDTGGAGSCLKRYSDPTFFKRVSGSPVESNVEKVQKDKKSRKSKKKRSSQKHGAISRNASMSNQSGRMQSASSVVNWGTSSQTTSTVDMTFRPDVGDRSNSFESRNGSGYIECDFNLSSSMQGDGKESKGSFSRLSDHVDTLGSVSPDERIQVMDNSFSDCPPEEHLVTRASCVTWDEKAEIVDSKGSQLDIDETSEMLETNLGIDLQDKGATNSRNADTDYIFTDDVGTPKSISSRYLLNEIVSERQLENDVDVDSEPDNFMDALNTIESESENDIDYQTKREVDECFNSDAIEDGMHNLLAHSAAPDPLIINSPTIEDGMHNLLAHSAAPDPLIMNSPTASEIPTNHGINCSIPDLGSSECFDERQMAQVSGGSSDSDPSPISNFDINGDIPNCTKTDTSLSVSGSEIPEAQGTLVDGVGKTCEPQEPNAVCSNVHPVKIWTNGSLLGLEPSKPPDFAVRSTVVEDSMAKGEDEVNGCPNEQKAPSSSREIVSLSVTDLDSKLGKYGDAQRISHANGIGLTLADLVTQRSEPRESPDVNGRLAGPNQVSDENSSALFGFSHRLLGNSFRRKASLVQDSIPEPANTADTMDWRGENNSISYKKNMKATFEEQFGAVPPLDPLTSSPPLEHMRISFNPVVDFQTSKLKLKLPDRSQHHESIKDMFPSFQLVPDLALPRPDAGYDSDDGTFCRSSPDMSDDCLSHPSGSDSEQWESGETFDSKNQELYDALCRMSSMESVPSFLQVGETENSGVHVGGDHKRKNRENSAENSLSGTSCDLSSFEAVNSALQLTIEDKSTSENVLDVQSPTVKNPSPPPLPPMQWRISKTQSELMEDKEHTLQCVLRHDIYQKLPVSADTHNPAALLPNEKQSIEDTTVSPPERKPEEWKLNGKKKTNLTAIENEMDEKEDFLQQIRTKSFNLRRTVTAKPPVASGPTNVQVNAILQKANAIRQAVASDDGEDNWSDS